MVNDVVWTVEGGGSDDPDVRIEEETTKDEEINIE